MNTKYIIIFFFSVFFIFYFYLIYANYKDNKEYVLNLTVSNQISMAQSYKTRIDERISNQKKLLEETAKFVRSKDADKDYDLIRDVLRILARTAGFSEVYVGYSDTNKVISSDKYDMIKYYSNYDVKRRPWHQIVKSKQQTSFTEPYIDTKLKKYVISIAVPIYKNNKLDNVLVGDFELDAFQKEMASFFPSKYGSAFLMTDGAKILDSTKQIIDYTDAYVEKILFAIYNKKQGSGRFLINGKKYIFVYDMIAYGEWISVSILEEDKIYENLNAKTLNNLLVFLFLMIFGVCISVWMYISQKRINDNKHFLSLFSKSSINGLVITDKNGEITFINKTFEKIFSLKFKEFIGKNISELFYLFNDVDIFEQVKSDTNKNILVKKNIRDCFYGIRVIPLLEKGDKFEGVMIVAYDMTHETQLEMNRQQQERILIENSKMAALGEMSSAISHQWRQPLNALLLLVSDIEAKIEQIRIQDNAKSEVLSRLGESRTNIELMDETINIFKNFYKESLQETKFNLLDIMDDILYICKPQIMIKGIHIQADYEIKDYEITSYSSYIKQVLLNLISNAKDELVKRKLLDENFKAYIKISIVEEETRYIINVEDNGAGVGDDIKEHIFEPFFTTKGKEGTGMGLYLCKLIFDKKINGDIILSHASNPTIFSVVLYKNGQ